MTTWPRRSLDDLVTRGMIQLGRGKVISKQDLATTPGNYPVYSSAKEGDGIFGRYGLYMFDEELITWSVDGGGRLFHRRKHRFSVTNVGGTLRIVRPDLLDYPYLYYVLTHLHSQIAFDWVLKAHPSVLRRLYTDIPIPSLPEQQRIVAILDQAFDAIATATANVRKSLVKLAEASLKAKDALFVAGDGWRRATLGSVAEFRNGLNFTKLSTGESIRIVGVGDFGQRFTVPSNDELAVARINGTLADRDQLRPGDILTVRSNGNRQLIGRSMLAESVSGRTSHSGFVIRTRLTTKALRPDYLCHYMRLPSAREELVAGGSGTNISSLSQDTLARLRIAFPDTSAQETIVHRAEILGTEMTSLEHAYTCKLTLLAELKQALLDRAFAGELTEADAIAA